MLAAVFGLALAACDDGARASRPGGAGGGAAGSGGRQTTVASQGGSGGNPAGAGGRLGTGGALGGSGGTSAKTGGAGGLSGGSGGSGGTSAKAGGAGGASGFGGREGEGGALPGSGGGTAAAGGTSGLGGAPTVPDTPWVDGACATSAGTINLETAELCVSLSKTSQTVTAFRPKGVASFDFTPADLLASRSAAGYFHLGDITLRVRPAGGGAWQNVTTSASRAQVTARAASGEVLAAAELAPALPASFPLGITRSWRNQGGRLVLRFELENTSSSPVQIGALGIPMVWNNVITNRSLEQAHAQCSFADPYIGRDAGYVQVTRLSGAGPALLVLPEGQTPLEAYGPILNAPKTGSKDPVAIFTDGTPRGQTFEGFHEWLVHSKAYADGEWAKATPWNPATELTLAPGERKSYGLVFVLAPSIRELEKTLVKYRRPVAVGIPGYVVPSDLDASLFLNYPFAVSTTAVEPPGALAVTAAGETSSGWKRYRIAGKTWGRSRLTVTYADGTAQTIHYYVTKPAGQALDDLGTFLTSKAWFPKEDDPFGRGPSVMTYDNELGQIVTQARQAWVCGLGDDGGATWLAGAMKLLGRPDAAQVRKYQDFVDKVVWGGLQYSSGAQAYGVKRTLFYYEPTQMPAGTYSSSVPWTDATSGQTYWGAWSKAHTLEVPRSYNYPHVAALYWVMYRLARNHTGLVDNHPWDWYLNQAYKTAIAMTTLGNEYAEHGLMDGTVFLEILRDLEREELTTQAADLRTRMKARADIWNTRAYPFGSEMAWDSTGQEEVYAWTRHFGYTPKAKVCVDAITGYMPALPHWGYSGCARRYWDFLYGGSKTDRLERMIHHYGSSLNAIPVLTEFRDHPDDLHLLRIGHAGMMGTLSNIAEDGFPSMAFHAFPDTLAWDPISGDVGLAVFGHVHGAATYLVLHPDFGWQAFGGNLAIEGDAVTLTPLDSLRRRVYLAPAGLWLTLDAGRFEAVAWDPKTGAVRATLVPADDATPAARLRIEQPAAVPGLGAYAPTSTFAKERGAHVIPLGSSSTSVALAPAE